MQKRFASLIAVTVLALPVAARAESEADSDSHVQLVDPPVPHRWRWIAVETVGLFGLGQAWYWRHGASGNSGDWVLPFNWNTIGVKLSGAGLRYDGDGLITNGLKHPLFGLASYEIARENGFGVAGSFLFASLTSGLWETFGEWREYGSINDLMFTSTTGVPIGEALHQMLHHVRQTRLEVLTGFGNHREGATSATFETVVVHAALDTGTRAVALDVAVPFDEMGRRGLQLDALATLTGIKRGNESATITSTFDYRDKNDRSGEAWDAHAMVGLGPTAAVTGELGDAKVDIGIAGLVEVGMEKAWALETWRASNPGAYLRASVQTNHYAYYHGLGVNASSHATVSYRGIRAGAYAAIARYSALHGHDRFADQITADPDLVDRETTAGGWFGLVIGRAVLRLDIWQRGFAGRADDVRAEVHETDVLASAGIRL